jgi:hypothetical protein
MGGKNNSGGFRRQRKTISKRTRAKLAEVKDQIKWRRHLPIPQQEKLARQRGARTPRQNAVPGNTDSLQHSVTR